MGLFSKKNKKNDYDPRKSYVPEVTYDDDLPTTLLNAIGIGSRDVKKVDLKHDDDIVTYVFDSGTLKSVESEKKPLELFQRFYWADKNKYEEETLEKIAILAQEHKIPGFYGIVKEEYPNYLPLIDGILYSYSVSTILENVNKKIIKLDMDILLGAAENSIYELNFLHIDSQSFDKVIKGFIDKEEIELETLTGSTLKATTLNLKKTSFDPESDEDRIIHAAAESESNLEDIRMLSEGFVFGDLLSRLNDLVEKEIIEIDDPVRKIVIPEDDELPSFFDGVEVEEEILPDTETIEESDEEPLVKLTPVVPSPSVVVSIPNVAADESAFAHPADTAEKDWEYSAPTKIESDDGDFVYEEFSEETEITDHVLDGFEEYAKLVLSKNDVSKEIIKEVTELLRKNEGFEKETFGLDGEISGIQEEYEQTFHKFQYTAVDKEFNDNKQITEEDLDEMRNRSNQIFEELYELEQERLIVGKNRKQVLKKLKKIVSHFDNGNVQELVYKIEQKIEAIDSVDNKALHTTKDDEALIGEAAITILEPKSFDIAQTPLFHKLVSQHGNPFPIEPSENI